MMAQDRAESTKVTICYRCFIYQFPTDTIKSFWLLERTYTKICRQSMSTLFNQISTNEEMLHKFTYFELYSLRYQWIKNTQYLWESICRSKFGLIITKALSPPRGLITLMKELTAATHVIQSLSNELGTLVSGKANCKQMKATT